jgi:hypothetical protein
VSDRTLSPAHWAQLEASGIRDDVIAARGYSTITKGQTEAVRSLSFPAAVVDRADALVLPLHDVYGSVALQVIRPDVPRLNHGRALKYEVPRGSHLTLDVPPMARAALSDATVPLWITEGQKKADAAISHGAGCAIAFLGVWNWKSDGVACAAWEQVRLKGRVVFIAFDSDAKTSRQVQHALRRLKAFLGSRGAEVRIVHLEPGPENTKVGLDDALAGGATLDQLAATATRELRVAVAADDKRPILDVTLVHRGVVVAAFGHLATAGVYRTTTGLVVIRTKDGPPRVYPLSLAEMRTVLDRTVRCMREGVPVLPTRDLAEALVNNLEPPLPFLKALATAPIFTDDWRYLDQPGYDAASGLFLTFTFTPRPVPTNPSDEEVEEARRWWNEEALVDFPFASPADRTSALALALTPFVRDGIDGYTPLFVITAPKAGSGKDLLVKTALMPSLGRRGWASVTLGKDEELRKALTTHLREQSSALVFGNVSGFIHSPILAKVLTDDAWTDRLLGLNRGAHLTVRAVWALTSNNATLEFDLARRTVPIKIVPLTDHPELRDEWKHPEQEQWITSHRADLLWALAVLVQRWIAKGRPGWAGRPKTESAAAIRPIGNYEAWCRIVGGILTSAGYSDFLENRSEVLSAADQDTGIWEVFFADWWNRHHDRLVSTTELLPLAEEVGVYINGDDDRARVASLGKALGQRRDSLFGPYQLRQGTGRSRRRWHLRQHPKPVTGVTDVPGVSRIPMQAEKEDNSSNNVEPQTVRTGVTRDTRGTPVTDSPFVPGDAYEPEIQV